jgi:elongation factor P
VDKADVSSMDLQYSYNEGESFVFMNIETFEELRISNAVCKDQAQWLMEGTAGYKAILYNDNVSVGCAPLDVYLEDRSVS